MHLTCATCGVELTVELTLLEDEERLSTRTETPRVPRGTYILSQKDRPTKSAAHYIVHLQDLRNVEDHPEDHRLEGCCGSGGYFGINAVCLGGHEVAVRRDDCGMTHSAAFPTDLVAAVAS